MRLSHQDPVLVPGPEVVVVRIGQRQASGLISGPWFPQKLDEKI